MFSLLKIFSLMHILMQFYSIIAQKSLFEALEVAWGPGQGVDARLSSALLPASLELVFQAWEGWDTSSSSQGTSSS